MEWEGTSKFTKERGAITLTIELNYEDENGYMTNIATDLVMNNVVNRPPASQYSLASYSMFTGGGVQFRSNDDSYSRNSVFHCLNEKHLHENIF